jgi:hypothetical protein
MRATVLAFMSLTLLAAGQDLTVPTLVNTTDLSDSPDGRRLGVLLSGAPVRVLERDGNWARVSVEGWIEANDLGAAAAAVAAPAATGRKGRLSGAVFIIEEDGSTTVGSAIAVRLLRDSEEFRASVDSVRAACDARREELMGAIEELKKEGDSALRRTDDTSEAFRRYDESKRRRRDTKMALENHDRECDGRLETAVEGQTVARTITSAVGRYEIPEVEPGSYILHVSLDSGDRRHAWDVEISLRPGEERTLDLTGENRASAAYR